MWISGIENQKPQMKMGVRFVDFVFKKGVQVTGIENHKPKLGLGTDILPRKVGFGSLGLRITTKNGNGMEEEKVDLSPWDWQSLTKNENGSGICLFSL